ncbi:uncharacterized protein LOC107495138 isoform X3 [Arachis duranensis]|uniref:Uncharacterized protein LOC107495138 isoform X3 n=1 Tax=Arachis duranensis TaxID=130453 RepID=A0A9C6WHD7_ARADU|nr:uncharacterized protein LOC112710897 isoform X3 [Arachis hypogaea]XP_052109831.1 uncharacterized protein LOC107495138 isoform X3 [Arachis duranensis]
MEPPSKLSHGERWLASEGWSWAWSCRAFVAVVQREASYCRCFSQSSLLPPCRRGGGRRVAQSERGRKHRSRGERGETCAGHRRFCRSEPCCRHRKTLSPPSRSRGGRKSHWVTPHLASTALSPKTTTESSVLMFMLLQKCVGLCFEAAVDFGLKLKDICEAFGIWFCISRSSLFQVTDDEV